VASGVYHEKRGILARYGIEAALPAAAVLLGRNAVFAEYPSARARRRLSLLERAERAEGHDGSGWVLYRIAKDSGEGSDLRGLAMDEWWSEIDDAVLACLKETGETSPDEIGRRLGLSSEATVSVLGMLAQEGRIRISRVEANFAPPGASPM